MTPPISIDGTDITGATIDGTDVQEITVDGDTVFTAGPDVPANTVGYWPGDEGSGTILGDKVGTNDLNISGPSWISDSDFKGGKGLDFGSSRDDSNEVTGTTLTPSEFSWFIRVNLDEITSATSPADRNVLSYNDNPRLVVQSDGDVLIRGGPTILIFTISLSGTVTIVVRLDSSSYDLDVFDDTGSSLGSDTDSGFSMTYDSSTVSLGQGTGGRDWQGNMDPNWMQLDKRVSDSTMNNIISTYFV